MPAPLGNHNHLGKTVSAEGREKMRQARLKNPNKYWLGKKRSEETNEKISKAKKGRPSKMKGIRTPEKWGEKHYLWKGGTLGLNGYLYVCIGGRHITLQHYLIEKLLGRKLTKKEEVHHIDGNKLNNKIDNLVLLSKTEHRRKHLNFFKDGLGFNRWNGKWEDRNYGISKANL